MTSELIGKVSGALVVISAIPYTIRVWQRKITPNAVSWFLWALIGIALLVNYWGSGAKDNVWPAVFGASNPTIIFAIALFRNRKFEKLGALDYFCLFFGLLSLGAWVYIRDYKALVQYALYIGIVADAFASIPTLFFLWKEPWQDRPFAWGLFSIGYGLGMFAITEYTFANFVLPAYMFIGSFFIIIPLIRYRVKNNVAIREWI